MSTTLFNIFFGLAVVLALALLAFCVWIALVLLYHFTGVTLFGIGA